MQGSSRLLRDDSNLDLLNLIGEMKKELEHDRICGH